MSVIYSGLEIKRLTKLSLELNSGQLFSSLLFGGREDISDETEKCEVHSFLVRTVISRAEWVPDFSSHRTPL